MRSAISFCFGVSLAGSVANQWQASRIDMSATWPICRRSIFTASACGFRRLPAQASQGWSDWKRDSSSRTQEDSVSRQRRSILVITPSKGLVVE